MSGAQPAGAGVWADRLLPWRRLVNSRAAGLGTAPGVPARLSGARGSGEGANVRGGGREAEAGADAAGSWAAPVPTVGETEAVVLELRGRAIRLTRAGHFAALSAALGCIGLALASGVVHRDNSRIHH